MTPITTTHTHIRFPDMSAPIFKVRVVAAFVQLTPSDFNEVTPAPFETTSLYEKLSSVMVGLNALKVKVEGLGLEVQTLRIATNTFTEYMNLGDADALVEQVKVSWCDAELARSTGW